MQQHRLTTCGGSCFTSAGVVLCSPPTRRSSRGHVAASIAPAVLMLEGHRQQVQLLGQVKVVVEAAGQVSSRPCQPLHLCRSSKQHHGHSSRYCSRSSSLVPATQTTLLPVGLAARVNHPAEAARQPHPQAPMLMAQQSNQVQGAAGAAVATNVTINSNNNIHRCASAVTGVVAGTSCQSYQLLLPQPPAAGSSSSGSSTTTSCAASAPSAVLPPSGPLCLAFPPRHY